MMPTLLPHQAALKALAPGFGLPYQPILLADPTALLAASYAVAAADQRLQAAFVSVIHLNVKI